MCAPHPRKRHRNDPGVGRDSLTLMGWRLTATPSVATFGRGAARFDPKRRTGPGCAASCSGPAARGVGDAGGHQLRVLPAARAGPRRIRPLRSSTRLRGVAAGRQGDRVSASAGQSDERSPGARECRGRRRRQRGTDRTVRDAAIVASRCLDVLAANSIARALSPGFAPGRSFCAGGSWRLPHATSTLIGMKRPMSP